MDNNIVEIIKLFQQQISDIRELLEEKIMAEGARVAAEINMHKRDKHLEYWDPTYYLEFGNKQREKISELHKKFEETNKKITELIKVNDTVPLPDPFGMSLHGVLPS